MKQIGIDKNKFLELFNKGYTDKQLSLEFNCSEGTIRRFRNKNNYTKDWYNKDSSKLDTIPDKDFIELYESNSKEYIVNYFNVCWKKIENKKKEIEKRLQINITKYKKIPEEELDKLKNKEMDLYEWKEYRDKLLNKYKICPHNLGRQLKEIYNPIKKRDKINIEELKEQLNTTKTLYQIADHFNVSHDCISYLIKQNNLERNYNLNTYKVLDKVSKHTLEEISRKELMELTGVSGSTIDRLKKKFPEFFNLKEPCKGLEKLVLGILYSYDKEVIRWNKTLIKPYEIDIYLPDYNLGIEVNDTKTHNYDIKKKKPKNYHKMKTDLAIKNNVNLIHIFEWELLDPIKYQIIKSILYNQIGKSKSIGARDCIVKEVSFLESKDFLNKNHLQGNVISKYRYGLYYNNELVSIMTFGNTRKTIGNNQNIQYELLRFSNKCGYHIIGGASKLFNKFITEVKPQSILSYQDRAHFNSNLYEKLGFEFIGFTNPGYVWTKPNSNEVLTRNQCQKKKLVEKGFDKDKSEIQIMRDQGYCRVFNSGNNIWVWKAFNKLEGEELR